MSDQEFQTFVNLHRANISANLNLTDDILVELHVAGVLTDAEYFFLNHGNPVVDARAPAFCNVLDQNSARLKIKVDDMITVFQRHQRAAAVVEVLQQWSPWSSKPVGRIQLAPLVAQVHPNPRASVEAGFTLSRTKWCDFLGKNNQILRQTLFMNNDIVEALRCRHYFREFEVEQIIKFSEVEKDRRAAAFLELIRDKEGKIETLIEAFKNDRHMRPTPAFLMSAFLQEQSQQQVHQIQPAQDGHGGENGDVDQYN